MPIPERHQVADLLDEVKRFRSTLQARKDDTMILSGIFDTYASADDLLASGDPLIAARYETTVLEQARVLEDEQGPILAGWSRTTGEAL